MDEPQLPPVFAVDHSADSLISISGADRAKFLHGFCTNDIKGLVPGQGREAFITSSQGKTIGHVIVDCQEDRLLLHTVPGQAEKLIKHLDRYVITEDVTLQEVGGEYTRWLVAGTNAASPLPSGAGVELPQVQLDAESSGEIRMQKVPFLGNSFLITAPKTQSIDFLQSVRIVTDPNLLAGLRIEANWPLFGEDITDDNLPQEIGRDRQAISFTKGCYLGQETVARLDALGHVNRILTRVQLSSPVAAGTELLHEGKSMGKITSVGWSPRLSSAIAFAMLRVAQSKAGTVLLTSDEVEVKVPPLSEW